MRAESMTGPSGLRTCLEMHTDRVQARMVDTKAGMRVGVDLMAVEAEVEETVHENAEDGARCTVNERMDSVYSIGPEWVQGGHSNLAYS